MKTLFVLALSLFLTSCANLSSLDKPVCVEINMSKGHCVSIISGKPQTVDDTNLLFGRTWFESRIEMMLVPRETWAAIKTYIVTNCKRYKRCNANIDSWSRSMQAVENEIEKKVENESTDSTNSFVPDASEMSSNVFVPKPAYSWPSDEELREYLTAGDSDTISDRSN